MPGTQLLSLVLLFVVFGLAIAKRLNIGILALAATLPLSLVASIKPKQVFTFFDGSLVVLIAGVSLLFAHLKESGALSWLITKVFDLVGDRTFILPWVVFLLGATLSTAGAFSTAPIALLAPMVAAVSARSPRMFFINELAVIIGANMAGPSPLNPVGALISSIANDNHVSYSKWGLWAISMATAVVTVALLQVILTGTSWGRRKTDFTPLGSENAETAPAGLATPVYAATSVVALIAFVLLVVLLGWDVGLTAMALVVVLQLIFTPEEKNLLKQVPWNSNILLTGLLTYLGVMKKIGTMDTIQHGMLSIGSAALLLTAIAYLTALLCNIESSTLGVFGLILPIAMTSFPGATHLTTILAAIVAPAALMVVNPVHVAGTLVVAQAEETQQSTVFRVLLMLAITLAIIAPAVLLILPVAMM